MIQIVGVNARPLKELVKQTYETAENCMRTNYYGIKQLSKALIPLLLLSNSARIVNVSSILGQLERASLVVRTCGGFFPVASSLSALGSQACTVLFSSDVGGQDFHFLRLDTLVPHWQEKRPAHALYVLGTYVVVIHSENLDLPRCLRTKPCGLGSPKWTKSLLWERIPHRTIYIVLISNENARKELEDVDGLTEEKVDKAVEGFLEDVEENLIETNGWPLNFSAYFVSKAALNAYTRILAMKYPRIAINAVRPGSVSTDINYHNGKLPLEEGAKGPVMLALMPEGGPSGFFFDETNVSTI
nr:salutaridine reductase [Quercus suber]